MVEHEAYLGVTVDHLYQRCPALQRSVTHRRNRWPGGSQVGDKAITKVDPLGAAICGWCKSVYIAEKMR